MSCLLDGLVCESSLLAEESSGVSASGFVTRTPSDDKGSSTAVADDPPVLISRMEAIVGGRASSLLTRTGESPEPEVRLDDGSDGEETNGGPATSAKDVLLSASRSAIGVIGDVCTGVRRGSASVCKCLLGDGGGGGRRAGSTSVRAIGVVGEVGDLAVVVRMAGRELLTSRIMMLPPDSRSSCWMGDIVSGTTSISSAVGRSTGNGAGGFVTEIMGSESGTTIVTSSMESSRRGALLDEPSLRTGMGTSAAEVSPEKALSAASCIGSPAFGRT